MFGRRKPSPCTADAHAGASNERTVTPDDRRNRLSTGINWSLSPDPKAREAGLFLLNEYVRICVPGGLPRLAKHLGIGNPKKLAICQGGGKGDPKLSEFTAMIAFCCENEGIPYPFFVP